MSQRSQRANVNDDEWEHHEQYTNEKGKSENQQV